MYDVLDIIKNLHNLTEHTTAFKIVKDFERVLDELNIYVFENWDEGELIVGPMIDRYSVTCKFMWPRNNMPNPKAAKILTEYGCQVLYQKSHVLKPRKIKDPDDFRPGTRKGKIDAHPVWIVEIKMSKKLMQDINIGKENQINYKMAELMKYNKVDVEAQNLQQEKTNA